MSIGMSKLTVLFFVILISSLTTSLYVKKTRANILLALSQTNSSGRIDLSADNILESITINGIPVTPTGNVKKWTETKTVLVDIKPGDVIEIKGKNEGEFSLKNPAAIIATITYIDSNEEVKKISTDGSWVCNGSAPYLQGDNKSETIWKKVKGSFMSNIDSNAVWIWNTSKSATASCSVRIPAEYKKETRPRRCSTMS